MNSTRIRCISSPEWGPAMASCKNFTRIAYHTLLRAPSLVELRRRKHRSSIQTNMPCAEGCCWIPNPGSTSPWGIWELLLGCWKTFWLNLISILRMLKLSLLQNICKDPNDPGRTTIVSRAKSCCAPLQGEEAQDAHQLCQLLVFCKDLAGVIGTFQTAACCTEHTYQNHQRSHPSNWQPLSSNISWGSHQALLKRFTLVLSLSWLWVWINLNLIAQPHKHLIGHLHRLVVHLQLLQQEHGHTWKIHLQKLPLHMCVQEWSVRQHFQDGKTQPPNHDANQRLTQRSSTSQPLPAPSMQQTTQCHAKLNRSNCKLLMAGLNLGNWHLAMCTQGAVPDENLGGFIAFHNPWQPINMHDTPSTTQGAAKRNQRTWHIWNNEILSECHVSKRNICSPRGLNCQWRSLSIDQSKCRDLDTHHQHQHSSKEASLHWHLNRKEWFHRLEMARDGLPRIQNTQMPLATCGYGPLTIIICGNHVKLTDFNHPHMRSIWRNKLSHPQSTLWASEISPNELLDCWTLRLRPDCQQHEVLQDWHLMHHQQNKPDADYFSSCSSLSANVTGFPQ